MNKITELAIQIKNGNEEAIADLYEELCSKSIYIASQHLKTKEDAEDLFHDAFLRAISNLDKYDETKDFQPWFDVILVNLCKNHTARKDNSAVSTFTAINGDNSDEDNDVAFEATLVNEDESIIPEKVADMNALKDIMGTIIDELPDAQRQALVLFYYKDMSIKDIAKLQETSEDTVKSRLNYAKKKVKAEVETYEKKNGITLHSFAPFALLLLFIKSEAKAQTMENIAKAAGAGAGEKLAKASAKSIIKKLASTTSGKIGITAVAIVVAGGIGAGAFAVSNTPKETPEIIAETQSETEEVTTEEKPKATSTEVNTETANETSNSNTEADAAPTQEPSTYVTESTETEGFLLYFSNNIDESADDFYNTLTPNFIRDYIELDADGNPRVASSDEVKMEGQNRDPDNMDFFSEIANEHLADITELYIRIIENYQNEDWGSPQENGSYKKQLLDYDHDITDWFPETITYIHDGEPIELKIDHVLLNHGSRALTEEKAADISQNLLDSAFRKNDQKIWVPEGMQFHVYGKIVY